MKELRSPWVHWEGDTETPGADDLIKKHKLTLGQKADGINLESVVESGNDAYNEKRIEKLKSISVEEVLRPLFCTMDINLNSGTGDTNLFVDNEVSGGGFISFDDAIYGELKKEVKQRINGLPAKVDDTKSPFTYPSGPRNWTELSITP